MQPLIRVIRYVDLGYSAERVAELMEWPVEKVRAVKGTPTPIGEPTQRDIRNDRMRAWHADFKTRHGVSYSTYRQRQPRASLEQGR